MRGHYVVEYETGYPISRTDFLIRELAKIHCEKISVHDPKSEVSEITKGAGLITITADLGPVYIHRYL